jgi:hypothetical protein
MKALLVHTHVQTSFKHAIASIYTKHIHKKNIIEIRITKVKLEAREHHEIDENTYHIHVRR